MKKEISVALIIGATFFIIDFSIGFLFGYFSTEIEINPKQNISMIDNITDLASALLKIVIMIFAFKFIKISIIYKPNTKDNFYKYLFLGIGTSTLILLTNHYVLNPYINVHIPSPTFLNELGQLEFIQNMDLSNFIFFIFVSGILIPFIEEVYFRGLLFQIFRKKFNIIISIALVYMIFMIFHPIPQAFIYYFLFNLLLCWLYDKNKSILMPFLIHSFVNIVIIIQYMPQ